MILGKNVSRCAPHFQPHAFWFYERSPLVSYNLSPFDKYTWKCVCVFKSERVRGSQLTYCVGGWINRVTLLETRVKSLFPYERRNKRMGYSLSLTLSLSLSLSFSLFIFLFLSLSLYLSLFSLSLSLFSLSLSLSLSLHLDLIDRSTFLLYSILFLLLSIFPRSVISSS